MGLTFHVKSKPRLNTAHAAIATAAVSQRREGLPRTASIMRGQRGWTGVSSSARARARIASSGVLRIGARLLADRARSPTRRGTPRCAPARS